MRKELYEIVCSFEKIMYQIEDIKNITRIFQEYMFDTCSASMGAMQSIVNTQLRLLEQAENECLELDDRMDLLLYDVKNNGI